MPWQGRKPQLLIAAPSETIAHKKQGPVTIPLALPPAALPEKDGTPRAGSASPSPCSVFSRFMNASQGARSEHFANKGLFRPLYPPMHMGEHDQVTSCASLPSPPPCAPRQITAFVARQWSVSGQPRPLHGSTSRNALLPSTAMPPTQTQRCRTSGAVDSGKSQNMYTPCRRKTKRRYVARH